MAMRMSRCGMDYGGRGVIKTCPVCNRAFWIAAPEMWCFRREAKVKGKNTMLYFCRYSHKREWDSQHEDGRKKQKTQEVDDTIAERVRKRHVKTQENEWLEKLCQNCRYCMKGKYGFSDCSVNGYPINPYRPACKRFKMKEVANDK